MMRDFRIEINNFEIVNILLNHSPMGIYLQIRGLYL